MMENIALADSDSSRLSLAFSRFFAERAAVADEQKPVLMRLLNELCLALASGHSCIGISEADKHLALTSGLASERATAPLRVEAGRLYLHRYWLYEQRLADRLLALRRQTVETRIDATLLDTLFTDSDRANDWQRRAAENTLQQAISVIVGGPGTGKTTTVVKILALLQAGHAQPLHIALAAPTGKAAMRLQESIAANKTALPCSDVIKACIPENVSTLHHLLGAQPPSPYFRHNADNPLPHDVVVVDETSMVDIALMSKLVAALKDNARLILLGDKDQLASVESGAVLADLMAGLPEQTTELLKTYRFQGAIKYLATAINRQDAAAAWQCLQQPTADTALLNDDLLSHIVENYRNYFDLVRRHADFYTIFEAFNRFQVLCSNRRGPLSVQDINQRVTHEFTRRHAIRFSGHWYAGRPVMISENNAAMQLYNGDIGLCLPDKDSGQLRVYFPAAAGQLRAFQPSRLPPCETAFAMTIHKSQGSEFEDVLIVLPETVNPVLSKELLYTAVTRGKKTVRIAADEAVFYATIGLRVVRHSGLADKLRGEWNLLGIS